MQVHWDRGQSEECLIQGREVARSGRADDLDTLLARGQAYYMAGLLDRSSTLLRRVLSMEPANTEALWFLVHVYLHSGELEQDVEAGDAFLRDFGDDSDIHLHVAASHHVLGHHERAREHYEKAIAMRGEQELLTLLWSGLFFEQIGERDRAREMWRRGLELVQSKLLAHPDHVGTRFYSASFYGLLGEEASFLAEEERALSSGFNFLVDSLAAVHAKRGNTERAIELLHRSLRQGRTENSWKTFFKLSAIPPLESQSYDAFVKELEAEQERLRALY